MDASIIVAIITGICTLLGTTLTVHFGNKKVSDKTDLTLYRISELEKKQDKHNTLIERVYALEDRQNVFDEKLNHINKK